MTPAYCGESLHLLNTDLIEQLPLRVTFGPGEHLVRPSGVALVAGLARAKPHRDSAAVRLIFGTRRVPPLIYIQAIQRCLNHLETE